MNTKAIQENLDEAVRALTQSNLDQLRGALSIALLIPYDTEVKRYLTEEIRKIDEFRFLLETVISASTKDLEALNRLLSEDYPKFPHMRDVPPDILAAIQTQNAALRNIESLFELNTIFATGVISEVGPEEDARSTR